MGNSRYKIVGKFIIQRLFFRRRRSHTYTIVQQYIIIRLKLSKHFMYFVTNTCTNKYHSSLRMVFTKLRTVELITIHYCIIAVARGSMEYRARSPLPSRKLLTMKLTNVQVKKKKNYKICIYNQNASEKNTMRSSPEVYYNTTTAAVKNVLKYDWVMHTHISFKCRKFNWSRKWWSLTHYSFEFWAWYSKQNSKHFVFFLA